MLSITVCDGNPEFYPDDRNPCDPIYPELETVADRDGLLWHHVLVYEIQRSKK